jgi:hypothetical protein
MPGGPEGIRVFLFELTSMACSGLSAVAHNMVNMKEFVLANLDEEIETIQGCK